MCVRFLYRNVYKILATAPRSFRHSRWFEIQQPASLSINIYIPTPLGVLQKYSTSLHTIYYDLTCGNHEKESQLCIQHSFQRLVMSWIYDFFCITGLLIVIFTIHSLLQANMAIGPPKALKKTLTKIKIRFVLLYTLDRCIWLHNPCMHLWEVFKSNHDCPKKSRDYNEKLRPPSSYYKFLIGRDRSVLHRLTSSCEKKVHL